MIKCLQYYNYLNNIIVSVNCTVILYQCYEGTHYSMYSKL